MKPIRVIPPPISNPRYIQRPQPKKKILNYQDYLKDIQRRKPNLYEKAYRNNAFDGAFA